MVGLSSFNLAYVFGVVLSECRLPVGMGVLVEGQYVLCKV